MSLLGGQATGAQTPTVHRIRISDSLYGVVIPIIYGRARVPSHCLWLGDQTSTLHKGPGKGMGGSAGGSYYTYTASFQQAVACGPITGIGRLFNSDSGGLKRWPAFLVANRLSVFLGAYGQAPWSHLVSKDPGKALGYTGIAYLAALNWNLWQTPVLPQWSFEVFGFLPFSSTILDANASPVIADMISNSIQGMVPGATWVDTAGTFVDYANYITAYNFFVSPTFNQQQPGKQWLALILELTHADCYWSEGQLRVVPYATNAATANGVTWTPNLTPSMSFTDDDYVIGSPDSHAPQHALTVQITDPLDRHNVIKVEFLDVFNDYNIGYAEQIDDNDMILNGPRRGTPRQYHPIPNAGMANEISKLKLAQELFVTRQYTWKVPPVKAALLDPMDVVALSETFLGLANYPVRIVSINESGDEGGKTEDYMLEITAEDLSPDSTPGYVPEQPVGPQIPSDGFQDPMDVNIAPLIFEPLTDGTDQYVLWFAASGGNGNYNWGGANIWMSTDGGSTYNQIATVTNPNSQGVLFGSLPSHADPDTTDTMQVDLTESVGSLTSIANGQADQGFNLCIVDNELIAFAMAASTATPYQYDCTYLRRGLYGTAIATHAIGAPFYFLGSIKLPDQSIAQYAYPPDLAGVPLFFKFTSFNILQGAEEDLSDVSPYTYTPVGPSSTNLNPTNALPWAANETIAAFDFITLHGYGYVALNSGTTGSSPPTLPKQFGASGYDNGIIWQNIGTALNIQKGSIVGFSIGTLATPLAFGNAPAWAATTDYDQGQIVTDSNGNGEQAVSGIDTDSVGNQSPGSWAGHFPYLTSGVATPTPAGSLGSAEQYAAETLAITPSGSAHAEVEGVTNFAPAGTGTSATLRVPTGTALNDLLIAQIVVSVALTVTPPGGWTLIDTATNGTNVQQNTYYRIAGASEPASYTWTWSGAQNTSATMLRIVGASTGSPINQNQPKHSSSNAPSLPSVTPSVANTLIVLLLSWNGSPTFTPPPSESGGSTPAWSGTEGTIVQDGALQWEQVGPLANYGQWVTVTSATVNVQDHTDIVRLTLTGNNSASNMAINDKIWVQFLNGATVVASGRATVSSSSTGSTTSSSGEASPVLLRKSVTGLSGLTTITAQVRATNGSGNGTFAFALNDGEIAMEDQIK